MAFVEVKLFAAGEDERGPQRLCAEVSTGDGDNNIDERFDDEARQRDFERCGIRRVADEGVGDPVRELVERPRARYAVAAEAGAAGILDGCGRTGSTNE